MKQNIIIILLSAICAILGYIAAQISNESEKQQQTQIVAASPVAQPNPTPTPSITTANHPDEIIDGGIISRPAPEYPAQSEENGEEGTVLIEILVEQNGAVSKAKVFGSSGYPRLDNAALRAFKNATYKPINNLRTKYIVKTVFSL